MADLDAYGPSNFSLTFVDNEDDTLLHAAATQDTNFGLSQSYSSQLTPFSQPQSAADVEEELNFREEEDLGEDRLPEHACR